MSDARPKNGQQIRNSIALTLHREADAILRLKEQLDDTCVDIVQLLYACGGRVIVIGMGKMGAIGRKFSSTLCSTGTPSVFLHPAEAQHGDLGIVSPEDVVVALSYSGQTEEIVSLIPHLLRQGIPLIALTGNRTSPLASRADLVWEIKVAREADEHAPAPTCSSTVYLAACDALAIALMQTRGFTQEQFAIFHPGGYLGRKLLLQVDDLMKTADDIPLVALTTNLRDTIVQIGAKQLGAVFAIDAAGQLVGVFTDGDLRRAIIADPHIMDKSIRELMTAEPKFVTRGTLAAEALRLMEKHSITVLPVVDDQQVPVGALHLHELVQAGLA